MEGMEQLNGISLITNKYDKVLDIISIVIENDKDLISNQKKVIKLLPLSKKEIDKVIDSYGIFWNNMPEDLFKVNTLEDYNNNLNKFSQYILYLNENMKDYLTDYGYTLLVLYYIKLGDTYLNNNV